jgi:NAD-dependent deacetylase
MLSRAYHTIVALTGAGISKESGLDTFCDEDGIWHQADLEDVATPEAFRRDPDTVQTFHNNLRRGELSDTIAPNAAHRALAELERNWPGELLLVTQNVDDLHERAGSRNLVHMHGELFKARCKGCGAVHAWRGDLSVDTVCTACGGAGDLRPYVVWFGEMPFEMDRIHEALSRCGLFVSIGTSGTVYPAAGFVQEAIFRNRVHTVELKIEPSEGASRFAEKIYGPAGEVAPAFVARLGTDP